MGKERKLTPGGKGISEKQQENQRKKIYHKPVLVAYPNLKEITAGADHRLSGIIF